MGLLTFERLMTGPLIHFIYWSGLGLLAIVGFGIVGAGAGLALREGTFMGVLLSVTTAIAGLLVLCIAGLVWRAVCEFFVAIFQISDDLQAMRADRERAAGSVEPR